MSSLQQLQRLLDFSKPFDVELLDRAVYLFYNENRAEVQQILVKFQQDPRAWEKVDVILARSKRRESKFLALKTLESAVKTRWKIMPPNKRAEIKNFIMNLVITISKRDLPTDPRLLREHDELINTLNMVLIEVVKHEWPHNWPNFIKEIVNSSKKSQNLCANNMVILRLLSEDVFDYSKDQMTQQRMKEMKSKLNQEFEGIYTLSQYILDRSKDPRLLRNTLQTLDRFLHWIPIRAVFQTKLVPTLVKFFQVPRFTNDALKCLSEIGTLNLEGNKEWEEKLVILFVKIIYYVRIFLQKLGTTELKDAYDPPSQQKMTPQARQSIALRQEFFRHLSLFIAGTLKTHLNLIESRGDDNTRKALQTSLRIMLQLSLIDDKVIFNICLELWNHLVQELYNYQRITAPSALVTKEAFSPRPPRIQFYEKILEELRNVLISKMAKPEEVLVVEDEHGQIVEEDVPDTDAKILYKNMRECLVYLTHLDQDITQTIMWNKLKGQVNQTQYSWNNLNRLCWAIGSISEAMDVEKEKTFLVRVIKELLGLCETKLEKDHKAVIASNIMYVVGQYPRFLKQHGRFLRTVVTKQFEFMHEKHPGVQDMACDTFLKIAKKCKKKFVEVDTSDPSESRPFINDILDGLRKNAEDLEESQLHTFYEAVAEIIEAQTNRKIQQQLIMKLMELPNITWSHLLKTANSNFHSMLEMKTVKTIVMVLKMNIRVAGAVGPAYSVQMGRLYLELVQVYKLYAHYVSNQVKQEGESALNNAVLKQMRAVKANALRLVKTYIKNCRNSDLKMIDERFLPEMDGPVLLQYKNNVPPARDYEVLNLYATIFKRLGRGMINKVPKVFSFVFQGTHEMISRDIVAYPEHRLAFINFLHSVTCYSFPALPRLQPKQFEMVVRSVILSIKSVERKVMETGLHMLLDLIKNFSEVKRTDSGPALPPFSTNFFKLYLIPIVKEVFHVLTDTFHKPGFHLQCLILAQAFRIVETRVVTVQLWSNGNFPNNSVYLKQYVNQLMCVTFKHVSPVRIKEFVQGLSVLHSQPQNFRLHVRDFLITLKEFSVASNTDFYRQEAEQKKQHDLQKQAQVKGLVYNPTPSRTQLNRVADEDLL
jgi:exportin-1